MKLFSANQVALPLPEGHRFPLPKYSQLYYRVLEGGLGEMLPAPLAAEAQLLRVHLPEYVEKVMTGMLSEKETRRIGFPWSPELVERSLRSVGGSIATCRAALSEGLAANLGGGTHHAYADHGEGYCVFNDVAVAARAMQDEGRARRIVVIDCDVHQGNGTAAIFAGDESVFTFSIHGQKNFPFHKEQSDLDVALPDGSGDEAYLAALDPAVDEALWRAQADLAIYIAGADPYEGDRLGRMKLTKAGLLERDRRVFARLQVEGLPVAVVMGGGYAKEISDIADIHYRTLELAGQMWRGEG